MLIDLAEENVRRNEPIWEFEEQSTAGEKNCLAEQVKLLDEKCPRYDVHNVNAALFPKLISSDYEPAQKRNSEVTEKRNALLKIANTAPLGPPWDNFYLEYRFNDLQRAGYLVRWDAERRRHVCTALYESMRDAEVIELIADAFEIILGPDDLFSSYQFRHIPENMRCNVEEQAELVRTVIELLNWDREDVPTMTYTDEKHGKPKRKEKQRTSKKSNPTIIRFEPFLKDVVSRAHRALEGCCASSVPHLVRGHYKNYRYEAPLFGHRPVLGKTYGRLRIKPHQSGGAAGGVVKTPTAIITIGELSQAA